MVVGSRNLSAADQEPPPVVEVAFERRLHPPRARPDWIARPHLLRQIEMATKYPVLLVSAPAGYGKTTLVAQWVSSCHPEDTAWIDLDPGHNDPTRLWADVAAALELVGCHLAADTVGSVATDPAALLTTTVLPRILEALRVHPHPLTVVVDDLQVLQNATCSEQLDHLMSTLPDHVHLVLVSRSDPQLRLGRLRVDGKLVEIRAADLSFTVEETAAVLRTENGSLSDDAVLELARRTEGWPAAVYLAALSLVDRSDPEEFVRGLSGSDRLIADYLSEEVLARQDSELRDFILDLSIFDHFTADLANHVRQTRSSTRLLRQLERTNLFLVPLQDADWYRFHHLFATFARSALEVERPEAIDTLHYRAAQWYAGHGDVEEAVHHLLAAHAWDDAANLVQANWIHFFDAGRVTTILGWLRELKRTPADAGPAVTVTAAWISALTGNRIELQRRLHRLQSMVDDSPLPDGTTSPQAALVLIRGMFGFDGPDQMLADASRAVELESDSMTPWYAVARSALGYAGYVIGDVELARRALTAAMRAPAAPATTRVLALGTLALCEAEQGRTDQAARLADEAMAIVTEHAMHAMPQSTFAATAYGTYLAADNRLTEAADVLERALVTRRAVPGLSPWPLLHHLLAMAVVAARSKDPTRAEQLLAEADDLIPWTDEGMTATRHRIAAVRSQLTRPPRSRLQVATEPLTPRELEILQRLRGSQTLREIAADLHVSHNTVKTITSSLYRKLGAHSRVEAVNIAGRRGQV